MNPSNNMLCGTFFETLWSLLSSRVAMSIYFVLLFGSIAAMIISVLYLATEKKQAKVKPKKDVLPEEEQDPTLKEETFTGALDIKDDDDITSRFHTLVQLDRAAQRYKQPRYDKDISLKMICQNFRNYAASVLGLYYSEEDIRKFIAGIGVSHLMVMQGLSGTGKTSMATAFGSYLQNPSTVIPVQPMWKERSDIIGYFNEFTKRFSEGTLLKKLYEARYTDEIYVIVLDEMNIARVEYYFADFLSQMELSPANRYLEVVSDTWDDDPRLLNRGMLRIPENVWFIGTANNDDSTFAISDKVYDRAMLMNLDRKADLFEPVRVDGDRISFSHFKKLVEEAKETNNLTEEMNEKIRKIDEFLTSQYHITYGNRIRRQMEEFVPVYIACGGTEIEAIDDMIAKKVLRKLDGLSPVILRYSMDALENIFETTFGLQNMTLCKESLERLRRIAM
ncbi:MAG: AAA family ATPase [Lachnospiraceae bacterium]|nr:AAA family ATPase [Lachnospiraceae bacterium]